MNIICSILLALTYVPTPAKAAHRLSDEQILEVIRSAPSGAAVTVPADFFRGVIAGKFRWRNATNWIERASGDRTMVKALDSMNQEMDLANKSNAVTQSINRRLRERVDNLRQRDGEGRLDVEGQGCVAVEPCGARCGSVEDVRGTS